MSATARDGAHVAMLQRMLAKRPPPGECCDFCATPIPDEHRHLVELAARRILCACRACSLVFEPAGAAQGRYRPIPSRYAEVPAFAVEDGTWEALAIPIGLAFFFHNSLEGKTIAFYPSPAGATESLLPLESWNEILAAYPLLRSMESDVEAAIVRRTENTSRCYLVPIDAAYELVGIVRSTWKGFDGGEEARGRIDEYFARLAARSAAADVPAS